MQARVLAELGQLIVGGHYQPGTALPTEPGLAIQFGVSMTVIRETVRALAAKGLVETRARLGTRVTPMDTWHMLDPDVLAWKLAAEPDPEFIRDLENFRLGVEPIAARLAATHASETERQHLDEAFQRMRRHIDNLKLFHAADLDFHTVLLGASHNLLLSSLRDAVRCALPIRHATVGGLLSNKRQAVPAHERVAQAVQAGDPDAAEQAMLELLRSTIRDDLRLLDPDVPRRQR